MIISWKQNLKKLSTKEYLMLREMCHLSKNVYNESIYNIRQHYKAEGTFLKYEANYYLMKDSDNYKSVGTVIAQQTMKCADASYRSFFKLLEAVKNKKFSCPQINEPRYLPKDGFYSLHIADVNIKDNYLLVPTSVAMRHKYGMQIKIRVPDKLLSKKIRQAHIIPKHNGKYFEVRYIFDEEDIAGSCIKSDNAIGIDFGVNNFATCASNTGEAFIIDGKKLKSINQWYNKELSRLSSIKDKQGIKRLTNQQYKITLKRNNKVNDYIYCTAKYIINYCLDNNISSVVVGYNEGFQSNSNIGKVNNQNFVMIPFGKLKSRLSFLCERNNIKFVLQEESYTSKASFLDKDEIPVWNPLNPKNYSFSGKRIKRGLYQSSSSKIINADVNAALNILNKSKLTSLKALQCSGEVVTPLRIRL